MFTILRELHIENIMQDVPAPKFVKKKPIVPFERDEVEAILKACSYWILSPIYAAMDTLVFFDEV